MADLITKYAFRDAVTNGFGLHFLGPEYVSEVIDIQPIDKYSIGMLHPISTEPVEGVVDDIAIGIANEDAVEDAAYLSNLRFPSSMGLTFAVKGTVDSKLSVIIDCAMYLQEGVQWCRNPINETFDIALSPTNNFEKLTVFPGLDLRFRIRPQDSKGHIAVTLVLVNTFEVIVDRSAKSVHVVFQPQITVENKTGSNCEFVDRSQISSELNDRDEQLGRLLYRHTRNYGTGHGCAVEWDNSGNTRKLWTSFLPLFDLNLSESNPNIDSWALDMRVPQSRNKIDVLSELNKIIDSYEEWIDLQVSASSKLPIDLQNIAESNTNDCAKSAARMRAGLALLGNPQNINPYRAFMYMSEAMVEQRIKSERILAGRLDVAPEDIPAKWRAFQLMFILQCLGGIVNPESEDREVADLLWFPTGGGKTEAYLGLIAFTLMLRRLEGRSHGVSAIMRYTLRLLTTQQFERAALLMCCCEEIRSRSGELGNEKFEVGLYLGRSSGTPNSLAEAKKAIDKLRDNEDADVSAFGNPIQINLCVWCGQTLTAFSHSVGSQCIAKCPDPACQFSSGLPWLVVDEDIYARRPNLIIGTVDKFAMLSIKEEAGRLFNRGAGQEPGIDLIIQDELHLISGPLGTLVGLYESAIDELGRQNPASGSGLGPRPKIIASTATIRRANEQVRAIFDRDVCQFPPSALDSRDSYFAVESPPERKGTRRYVGVMAPSLSQATALVRTYASLFHETSRGDWADDVRDVYWTLVAYFNSLRILASSVLLMQDDVGDRLELLNNGSSHIRKPGENKLELTSRASGVDIPKYLRQLRTSFPDSDAVEALLATNMISVGVDIDRLGLMVVAGQPQGTAEYIQASSRVGRRDPGLVFMVYNSTRSRDRSHYESFLPYHSALYRSVEATSVTPFSPRARERALHSVFVILCRFLIPGLQSNESAKKVSSHLVELESIKDLLIARANRVDPLEQIDVKIELDAFIAKWVSLAAQSKEFKYYKARSTEGVLLVNFSESDDQIFGAAPVLTSMRDVDQTSSLYEVNGRVKNGSR